MASRPQATIRPTIRSPRSPSPPQPPSTSRSRSRSPAGNRRRSRSAESTASSYTQYTTNLRENVDLQMFKCAAKMMEALYIKHAQDEDDIFKFHSVSYFLNVCNVLEVHYRPPF